jgi:hypothetical protein
MQASRLLALSTLKTSIESIGQIRARILILVNE